jgi:uncharacterized cupredoxin-like copper-binding protein
VLARHRSFHRFRQLTVGGLTLLLVLAGCADSEPESISGAREITVDMESFAYDPASFSVDAGTTVRFVFRNPDNVVHEAIIGDAEFQDEHEKRAQKSEAHHGGAEAVDVEPGKTGKLTHTFHEPGTLLIGCHEPGHYAGGMKAEVKVT